MTAPGDSVVAGSRPADPGCGSSEPGAVSVFRPPARRRRRRRQAAVKRFRPGLNPKDLYSLAGTGRPGPDAVTAEPGPVHLANSPQRRRRPGRSG